MNPELLRLMRRELSPLRLIGLPACVALIMVWAGATIYSTAAQRPDYDIAGNLLEVMAETGFWTLAAVASFWGARQAADAVAREIRERTWDTQRASGLGPTAHTLGKLFGAPSGAWYAVALLLLVQGAAFALLSDETTSFRVPPAPAFPEFGWANIATQLVGVYTVFAAALFGSMVALAGQIKPRALDTTLFQLAAVAGGIILTFTTAAFNMRVYWGVELTHASALMLNLGFIGLWATLGAWAQMRKAYGLLGGGLLWILFLIALPLHLLGWVGNALTDLFLLPAMAATAYLAALIEPHRGIEWRLWLRDVARGRVQALIEGPAWLYAWIACAVFFFLPYGEIAVLNQRYNNATSSYDNEILWVLPPASFLAFLLRDMLICVWAGARARDGRGLWTALLFFLALWGAAPAIAASLGAGWALTHVLPVSNASLISGVLQAAIAGLAAFSALRSK